MDQQRSLSLSLTSPTKTWRISARANLINLQDDFERFFDRTDKERNAPGATLFNPPKTGKRYPEEKFPPLQKELRELLQVMLLPPWTGFAGPISFGNIKLMPIAGGTATFTGEHRDVFLLECCYLLRDPESVSMIRQCEPCGKFFFRVRRQKYCSRVCTLRTNKKAYLDSLREKAEREKAKAKKKLTKKGRSK